MIFRMLIQKYSILYYIYITAVINIIYWIFLTTILTYIKYTIIKYTLYSIIIYDINCIKFLIRYIFILLYNIQYYYSYSSILYIYIYIYIYITYINILILIAGNNDSMDSWIYAYIRKEDAYYVCR